MQHSRSTFLFYLFLFLLPFLSIKSLMYSVKNNKFLLAHSSSFKSASWYLFIVVLRPLCIVSWHSSLVPSFIAVFSLSLCCPHPSLSPKPIHLRPSLYFTSIKLLPLKACTPKCKPSPIFGLLQSSQIPSKFVSSTLQSACIVVALTV